MVLTHTDSNIHKHTSEIESHTNTLKLVTDQEAKIKYFMTVTKKLSQAHKENKKNVFIINPNL